MIITIDGPVGSGKSSVAKKVAEKLGFYYLYTGLLYRAIAYILINKKKESITSLDKGDLRFINDIKYQYKGNLPQIIYKDEDITDYLYDIELSQQASIISANVNVRGRLLEMQRNVAKKHDIIAEGRDCGTVVFPEADYKFYLTASVDIRAKRIFADKKREKKGLSFEEVKVELEERDKRDKGRKVAPLTIPKDAIVIDSSELSEKETIEKFLEFIK